MERYTCGYATPFAHHGTQLTALRPDQIVRFLRMITSPACRRENRVPLSAIAVMIGRSRLALYRVLWTGRVSADMATVLTPVIKAFEAGKLRFRRSSPRDAEPNRWQMIDV